MTYTRNNKNELFDTLLFKEKKSGYGVGQIPRKCGEPEVGPAHQKAVLCGGVSTEVAGALQGRSRVMPGHGDLPADCEGSCLTFNNENAFFLETLLFRELVL